MIFRAKKEKKWKETENRVKLMKNGGIINNNNDGIRILNTVYKTVYDNDWQVRDKGVNVVRLVTVQKTLLLRYFEYTCYISYVPFYQIHG